MTADSQRSDGFKLPGSSLDEVFKVIQGYANFGKPASLADISKQTGMHPTVISRNVGFLLSLRVLEGGKSKSSTDLGTKLGLAIMHDVPEEVASALSRIVNDNEFLKSVLAAVRIRKGMDDSALRSHIAFSAGQSKTGSTSTGASAVIELLRLSGHLTEREGKLVVDARSEAKPLEVEASGAKPHSDSTAVAIGRGFSISSPRADSSFSINLDVRVNCNAEDLDDLGEKLRKVVEDFSKTASAEETNED